MIHIINEFLAAHFPQCFASALTGSAVDGMLTNESDIDVLIFSDYVNITYREKFAWQGYTVEAVVLAVSEVDGLLQEDVASGQGVYVNMIAKAQILRDRHQYLQGLIAMAQQHKQLGPPPLDYEQRVSLRSRIHNGLDDLRGKREFGQLIFIVNNVLNLASMLVLQINHHWASTDKWRAKHLQANEPLFYEDLIKAVDTFYRTRDPKLIITTITDKLGDMTQDERLNSTRYSLTSPPSGSRLIVAIKGEGNYHRFIENILQPLLATIFPDTYEGCYFYRVRQYERLPFNFAVVFMGVTDSTREHICELVEHWPLNTKPNGVPSHLQLTVSTVELEQAHYGGNAGFALAEELFGAATKAILAQWQKKPLSINQDETITHALLLYLCFGIGSGMNQKSFTKFNQYLLQQWLPRAYDRDNMHPHKVLLKKHNWIQDVFASLFAQQRPILIQLGLPFFKYWNVIELEDQGLTRWIEEVKKISGRLESLYEAGGLQLPAHSRALVVLKDKAADELLWPLYQRQLDLIFNSLNLYESNISYIVYLTEQLWLQSGEIAEFIR
jgi:hypothetical protein